MEYIVKLQVSNACQNLIVINMMHCISKDITHIQLNVMIRLIQIRGSKRQKDMMISILNIIIVSLKQLERLDAWDLKLLVSLAKFIHTIKARTRNKLHQVNVFLHRCLTWANKMSDTIMKSNENHNLCLAGEWYNREQNGVQQMKFSYGQLICLQIYIMYAVMKPIFHTIKVF